MAETYTAAGPRPCALDGCPNAFTPAGRAHGRLYCEALPVGTPTRPGQRVVALYEPWRGGWSVTAPSLAGEEARRLAASLSRREARLSRGAKGR